LGSELRAGATTDAGVFVRERHDLTLCMLIVRAGREEDLSRRVNASIGISLPAGPHCVSTDAVTAIGAGPRQWLLVSARPDDHSFRAEIEKVADGVASAFDQSDGRTVLAVTGPKAREALQKGVMIDLHASAFRAGHSAVTSVAHIGVHLWQVDDRPTYQCAVFRSFAEAFCRWLLEASAEFGVALSRD
jgi:sarcosine oxidase subunit gamma